MARAKNKEELISFSNANFETLLNLISGMTEKQMTAPFDFSGDKSKTEAHWARDKNVRDVIVHLYEWHQLLLA